MIPTLQGVFVTHFSYKNIVYSSINAQNRSDLRIFILRFSIRIILGSK